MSNVRELLFKVEDDEYEVRFASTNGERAFKWAQEAMRRDGSLSLFVVSYMDDYVSDTYHGLTWRNAYDAHTRELLGTMPTYYESVYMDALSDFYADL